jgi:hypothetical protein
MIPKTLLFVSVSRLHPPGESEQLQSIVEQGRNRNRSLGVNATLIAARGRFAEVLDGPEASLQTLMASIRADPRHEQVTTVLHQDYQAARPAGSGMELVYRGESLYIARSITPLLEATPADRDQAALAAQLLFLIRELGKGPDD